MTHNLIDTNFGISDQAYAVAQYLKLMTVKDLCTTPDYRHKAETRLMHNCREQGIALVLSRPNDRIRRVIWWAEHRNSDGIFVDWFESEKLSDDFNDVPTINDGPVDSSKWDYDKGTHGRKCFGWAEVGPVSEFIKQKVVEFWANTPAEEQRQ